MWFPHSYPNQGAPIAVLIDCIRDIIEGVKNGYDKIILRPLRKRNRKT